MSYQSDGEANAIFRPGDEVAPLRIRTTNAYFTAPGSLTEGRYGLFRWDMAASTGGSSPHFHRTFSESFFILSGTVQLYGGNRWLDAGAGDFLYVPEGGVHAFRNSSDQAASMLILFAPGAPRERYFEKLAEIADGGRELSEQEWTELYAEHDQFMV